MDRSEALESVREVLVSQLAVEPNAVVEGARFKADLGADSLDLIDIVLKLEKLFGISLPQEKAKDIITVGQCLDLVVKTTALT